MGKEGRLYRIAITMLQPSVLFGNTGEKDEKVMYIYTTLSVTCQVSED